MGEKAQGIRSTNGPVENRKWRGKRTYVRPLHGHELRMGNVGGMWGAGQRGINERKKWDNCNSIINKIYLKDKERTLQAA